MALKEAYDTLVSTKYSNAADRFGSITESHHCALAQIQAHISPKPSYRILDLGVGDGHFLKKISRILPNTEMTGIDLSTNMLKQATEKVPMKGILGSATDASAYLPPHSQDLILAHFINAYIPIPQLFEQASNLTRTNGAFSLITTTYESFPVAQKLLADFIAQDTFMSRIAGHYFKSVSKSTSVASNQEELIQAFATHQFKITQHQRLYIPIAINNLDELALFGIEGTWFLNSVAAIRFLPKNFLLQRLRRFCSKLFTFPYYDTHIIDVVLAHK